MKKSGGMRNKSKPLRKGRMLARNLVWLVEARQKNKPQRGWFIWSYGARPQKLTIMQQVKIARRTWPQFKFQAGKYRKEKP